MKIHLGLCASLFLLVSLSAALPSGPGGLQGGVLEIEVAPAGGVSEGPRPGLRAEHEQSGDGWLFVRTLAEEVNAVLRIRDGQGELLGEARDGGREHGTGLGLELAAGRRVSIEVEVLPDSPGGHLRLEWIELIEGEPELAARALRGAEAIVAALAEGGEEGARAELEVLGEELLAAYGEFSSEGLAAALGKLVEPARSLEAHGLAFRLAEARVAHLERSRPIDDPALAAARLELARELAKQERSSAALELFEAVLASRQRILPEDDLLLAEARYSLAACLGGLGDHGRALPLMRAAFETRERRLGPDHLDTIEAQFRLGVIHMLRREIEPFLRHCQRGIEALRRTQPEDHPSLMQFRTMLAMGLGIVGLHSESVQVWGEHIAVLERTVPADDPDLLLARQMYGRRLGGAGRLAEGREVLEAVLADRWRHAPRITLEYLDTAIDLALRLAELRDLRASRRMLSEVLERVEAEESELDSDLLEKVIDARMLLIEALFNLGDYASAAPMVADGLDRIGPEGPYSEHYPSLVLVSARLRLLRNEIASGREELERLVSVLTERKEPHDPELLQARVLLGAALLLGGDPVAATRHAHDVSEALERRRYAGTREAGTLKLLLGSLLAELGDRERGVAWIESALQDLGGHFSPLDPVHRQAQTLLAMIAAERGDHASARGRLENTLSDQERELGEDHAITQTTRLNLAGVLALAAEHDAALELLERGIELNPGTLPARLRFEMLRMRASLLVLVGRPGEAVPLLEELDRSSASEMGEESSDRIALEATLGLAWRLQGDPVRALAHLDAAAAAAARDRLWSRRMASVWAAGALVRVEAGRVSGSLDRASVRDRLERALGVASELALEALRSPPREALEVVAASSNPLAILLTLSEFGDEAFEQAVFELIELRRAVGPTIQRAASRSAGIGGLAETRMATERARARLAELLSGGLAELSDAELRERFDQALAERDRADSALLAALAGAGIELEPSSMAALAEALPEDASAVGFLRYTPLEPNSAGTFEPVEDRLLAHVLPARGRGRRVELGTIAELEGLARAWRGAIGEGAAARGLGLAADELVGPHAEREFGLHLRRRLFDPLLEATGGRHATLFLAPDDLVYLLPLDALPLDAEGVVGDQHRIVLRSDFGRAPDPNRSPSTEPSLLAVGGIEYGQPRAGAGEVPHPAPGPAGQAEFAPLPGAAEEVRAIGELFRQTFGRRPQLLERRRAGKAQLRSAVAGRHYVHLATHGWFAPDSVPSLADPGVVGMGAWSRLDFRTEVAGAVPLALCGLALSNANRAPLGGGPSEGLLTAEELAGFDLSDCVLAVLSACETQVGRRRTGQGIQSLMTALHAAGARTAVTSLWKVDDQATRELMETFYAHLWVDGLAPSEALWRAKLHLRSSGAPTRDWAAWVLSGEP